MGCRVTDRIRKSGRIGRDANTFYRGIYSKIFWEGMSDIIKSGNNGRIYGVPISETMFEAVEEL